MGNKKKDELLLLREGEMTSTKDLYPDLIERFPSLSKGYTRASGAAFRTHVQMENFCINIEWENLTN